MAGTISHSICKQNDQDINVNTDKNNAAMPSQKIEIRLMKLKYLHPLKAVTRTHTHFCSTTVFELVCATVLRSEVTSFNIALEARLEKDSCEILWC